MPALQFFAILREARVLEFERQAVVLDDLVDIAFCGQSKVDWGKGLKKAFQARYHKPKRVKPLDNKAAGAMLTSVFQRAGQNV